MKEKEQEVADSRIMIIEKTDQMEKVLQQVVKVLASTTNYATVDFRSAVQQIIK